MRGAGKLATAAYRGYLKPSLAQHSIDDAATIVQTALDEGLPITDWGKRKADKIIGQLNAEVNAVLNKAKGTVDLHQIAERIRRWGNARYNRPGAPPGDLEAILKVADDLDAHPSLGLPAGANATRVAVSPRYANETKQAMDRAIGETGFGVERGAATEARKQGRRAIRQDIEQLAPEVGPVNAREGRLIDARDAVQRASEREANRNLFFGVPSMLSGAGAVTAAGSGAVDPITAILGGFVARGVMDPAVMSRVAILAHRFSSVPGTVPADAVRLAIEEYNRTSGQSMLEPPK